MTVSRTLNEIDFWNLAKSSVDVEHAATAAGGVPHGTGAPPPMRYEGFEPSPYDHEIARESELGTVRAFCLGCNSSDHCVG
jgi:hypothetical protein